MRLSYYQFPSDTNEETLLKNGCSVILKDGTSKQCASIPNQYRDQIAYVDNVVGPLSVKEIKSLIRQFGGFGYTEHLDRDGGLFEVTMIQLKGNNSSFKYNRHL